jgi:hypothetical protein
MLPIDIWVCKLVKDEPCPIQTQSSLRKPELFFRNCLASQDRKQQIFETVEKGKLTAFTTYWVAIYARVASSKRRRPVSSTTTPGN